MSVYQALYRKWRPVTFDDVVGQEHVTTTLKNQVATGRPSHAYLFYGSRGTGKTSCSKILAKAVNCPNQKDGNPCGKCNICVGIDNDSILDITEIDAASNSGVDNIRDLREEASFTPVVTQYRVYIIDETHMLSTGAFNALLKIMEEPPPHVLFILATTEIHKVPATILSRCQRFDFQRIPSSTIAQQLLFIAEKENANLDQDAAALIARLSDGSMRDAISLLDLCLSQDSSISYKMVQQVAGLTDTSYLGEMAKILIDEDFPAAVQLLDKLWEKSLDAQQFCGQLMDFYRDLLMVKSVNDPTELIEATPSELELYNQLAKDYTLERVFYCMNTLAETLTRMSRTAQRRAELELGLLKLSNPRLNASPEALVARLEKLERNLDSLKHAKPVVHQVVAEPSEPNEESKSPEDYDYQPLPPSDDTEDYSHDESAVLPFTQWAEVLTVLSQRNKALHGTLINSKAYVVEDLLLVDAGSELFANMVRDDEYARNSLRDAAHTVTGITYRLGPYRENKYKVQSQESSKLDDVLQSAKELGIDIEIN